MYIVGTGFITFCAGQRNTNSIALNGLTSTENSSRENSSSSPQAEHMSVSLVLIAETLATMVRLELDCAALQARAEGLIPSLSELLGVQSLCQSWYH